MLEATVFKHLNFQHANLWLAYLMKPVFLKTNGSIGQVWENAGSTASKLFQSVNWVKNLTSLGILPFLTQSVEIPFPGVQIERQHGVNFLTDEDVQNTVSMTFFETSDWQMTKMFRDWISTYYDFNARHFDFSKGNFKSFCMVTFLGMNKFSFTDDKLHVASSIMSHIPTKVVLLDGLFPIKIDPLNLDYSGGEPLKINVTFGVDRVLDETNDPVLSGFNTVAQTADYVSSLVAALQ